MPVIEMPKKEEPAEQPATNNVPDRAEPADKEIIQKIQNDLLDDISDEGDSLVEVTERVIPTEDEVFNDPPAPKVEPVQEDPPAAEDPPVEFEEKKGKRKYVRKKEMTQKQRDHLAKIRVIAQEKRKQKKLEKEQQKQKEKEEKQIRIAEERILKKQREEQEEINKKNQIPAAPQQPPLAYSQADLEKAMFSAIASYETIRKKEKEEKKKRLLAEERERQMTRTLQQAIQPNNSPDQWRQFFS